MSEAITPNSDAPSHLAAMRDAAPAREWTILQASLALLLSELPQFSALGAVVEGLVAALPMVEDAYETGDFRKMLPRQLLSGLVSYGFAPESLPDGIIGDYDIPGGSQYMYAVLELCRASQKDRAHDIRLAFMVSAAANGIIAQMGEAFYRKNPDLFARVRDNHIDAETGDYSDPDAAKIPILLWMDEETAALDTALWLQLADRIEAAYAAL